MVNIAKGAEVGQLHHQAKPPEKQISPLSLHAGVPCLIFDHGQMSTRSKRKGTELVPLVALNYLSVCEKAA